jgi:1,5-anhydro-D-fructose reductase (1,5-anhydro-D-mannitol-forming)
MLSDSAVEVVHITTPNHLHAEQTIQAVRAGKHVLCEKPMALTVAECEAMIEACRSNGVKLGIGFQNRHHPAHIEARRLIASGEAGDVTMVAAQYCHGWIDRTLAGWRADPLISGGGSLMGMGLHCIDLLRFLLGKEVEEVVAISDNRWTGRPVEETMLVNLKFENGPFGSVIAGFHVPRSYNNLVIYGSGARITGIDTIGMPLKGCLVFTSENKNMQVDYDNDDKETGNYVRQAVAFNRCIDEDIEPSASGSDGLEMVRLSLSILESAEKQKLIRIKR